MLKDIFYSVFTNKCPKCHSGKVFKNKNPYALKDFDKMNEPCDVCGEIYSKEPGYFYGAMYVSYTLMVGLFLISWGINAFWINASPVNYLIVTSTLIVVLSPVTFRVSRLVWLNFFIRFDKTKLLTQQDKTIPL
jgi:uncharacterized protein (DUF983 family)